jgi:formate hydrogenlyase subunit 3/multisubunit Na+/H+ antiporter MnhD subunit
MNRVGDMGLSIGFFAMFVLFGSLDYATIFNIAPFMNETAITIIALLILSGAMAKSSQIPLHSWLPGSMEGYSLQLTYTKLNKLKLLIILITLVYVLNLIVFSYYT